MKLLPSRMSSKKQLENQKVITLTKRLSDTKESDLRIISRCLLVGCMWSWLYHVGMSHHSGLARFTNWSTIGCFITTILIIILLRILSKKMHADVLQMKEKKLKRIERRYQDYNNVIDTQRSSAGSGRGTLFARLRSTALKSARPMFCSRSALRMVREG
mgnify:CR=1 FL=1